jgi:hypothetical protein
MQAEKICVPSPEEHYGQVLGLNDHWHVSDIKLEMSAQRVSIAVEFVGEAYGSVQDSVSFL